MQIGLIMTLQDEYTTAVARSQDAWKNAAEVWTESIEKVTDRVSTPVVPVVRPDVTGVVEQWLDFTEQVAKVNREYVLNLAGVADAFSGAVRQHLDGLSEAVRDQAKAISHTAKEQVDKLAEAEREQIESVELAEREEARAIRNAERQQARQALASARERYQGQTKAELVEELSRRELPKTGNVDELIERLVDADTK